MNTVNHSTGLSGFQIRLGRSPRLIPPLIAPTDDKEVSVHDFLQRHQDLIMQAQDNLRSAKLQQAMTANESRDPDPRFEIGDLVMLSTSNRRRQYKASGSKRAAKFFPRWDGPYKVVKAYPNTSSP
jgi:hypothetical protein